MRIAVISDIHGNLEALSSVISDIRSRCVDKIICLGDVVGYGVNPNECIEKVQTECEYSIIGNHEAAIFDATVFQEFNDLAKSAIQWTRDNLNSRSIDFINSLAIEKIDGDFSFVHSTPYEPNSWYYISSMEDAVFNFNFFSTKFCLIGHTHVPGVMVMENNSTVVSVLRTTEFNYGRDFSENAKYMINVGSVGQPRDKNPKSCYALIDTDTKNIALHRVSYDIVQCQRKMHAAKMPEFLIQRLAKGM